MLDREEAAQRLAHSWMAANVEEGDKINEAIQALTER